MTLSKIVGCLLTFLTLSIMKKDFKNVDVDKIESMSKNEIVVELFREWLTSDGGVRDFFTDEEYSLGCEENVEDEMRDVVVPDIMAPRMYYTNIIWLFVKDVTIDLESDEAKNSFSACAFTLAKDELCEVIEQEMAKEFGEPELITIGKDRCNIQFHGYRKMSITEVMYTSTSYQSEYINPNIYLRIFNRCGRVFASKYTISNSVGEPEIKHFINGAKVMTDEFPMFSIGQAVDMINFLLGMNMSPCVVPARDNKGLMVYMPAMNLSNGGISGLALKTMRFISFEMAFNYEVDVIVSGRTYTDDIKSRIGEKMIRNLFKGYDASKGPAN